MRAKLFYVLMLIFLINCTQQKNFPKLTGDYPVVDFPGEEPALFAPGVVSTGMYNRDITITPDGSEIFFGVVIGRSEYTAIMVTRKKNGQWSQPEVAKFSANPEWFTLEPCISPDGKKLYFMSDRPDNKHGEMEKGDEDIWVMDRNGDNWGEPYNLGMPVNTEEEEYFPSITSDGTLYFTRQDKGSPIGYIYRSREVNGEYTEPERLPEQVNSGQSQYNAFIAPDESYIIVPTYGRDDSYGATDYYISFRDENDQWTRSINMGDKVNSPDGNEYSAYVSPDGEYLFFMSARTSGSGNTKQLTYKTLREIYTSPQNGYADIYWINAGIIAELRKKAYSQ